MLENALETLKDWLNRRRQAYQQTFDGVYGERVLVDLAKFCRAHDSTAHTDPHMAARLDGRREVWLRIQQHLQLDEKAVWRLYTGRDD